MKIILSATQAANTVHANTAATSNMALFLKSYGFDFIPVIGCYKSKKETSFLVNVDTPKQSRTILTLAKQYQQECILRYLDGGSNVARLYPDGSQEFLRGTFKQVLTVKGLDAYTIINGCYYAVV